jgi:hypothetical protein
LHVRRDELGGLPQREPSGNADEIVATRVADAVLDTAASTVAQRVIRAEELEAPAG